MKSSAGGGGVSQSEVAEGMLVKGDSGNLASSFFLFAPWLPGEASLFNGSDFYLGVLVWWLIFIVG